MDRTGATAEGPLAGGLVESAAAASTEACREGAGGGRNPYANFTLRPPSVLRLIFYRGLLLVEPSWQAAV